MSTHAGKARRRSRAAEAGRQYGNSAKNTLSLFAPQSKGAAPQSKGAAPQNKGEGMETTMEYSSKFFQNSKCEYFPCHKLGGDFNCLFCYCPMYAYDDCPGKRHYIEKRGRRIKVCTDCIFPHVPENYDKVVGFLKSKGK